MAQIEWAEQAPIPGRGVRLVSISGQFRDLPQLGGALTATSSEFVKGDIIAQWTTTFSHLRCKS